MTRRLFLLYSSRVHCLLHMRIPDGLEGFAAYYEPHANEEADTSPGDRLDHIDGTANAESAVGHDECTPLGRAHF